MYRPPVTEKQELEFTRDVVEFRKFYGVTQVRLAKDLEICRKTLQNIEAGRHCPYPDTIMRFRKLQRKYEGEGVY